MIKMMFSHSVTGAFGNGCQIPWDEEDYNKFFDEYTKDCIVVMSEDAFKGLSQTTPGRYYVVVGNLVSNLAGELPVAYVEDYSCLQTFLESMEEKINSDICVIGSRKMLSEISFTCSEAVIAEMDLEVIADKYIDFEDIYDTLESRMKCTDTTELQNGWLRTFKECNE